MSNATDVGKDGAPAVPGWRSRLREYARLMRLDRPIGIWLLLWPVLWALWISANGHPDERIFVLFVIGTFVMRSAGCVMNDFADREFDPHVRRTADRPLAKQSVSPAEALALFARARHRRAGAADPAQPPDAGARADRRGARRHLSVPEALLRAAAGLPRARVRLVGADGRSPRRPASCRRSRGCCSSRACMWTTAYDTIYAMVDREDDLVIGIRSSAILFGRADRGIIALLQLGSLAGLALVGLHVANGPLVLDGARDRGRPRRVPAVPDPRPQSGGLLPCVPRATTCSGSRSSAESCSTTCSAADRDTRPR